MKIKDSILHMLGRHLGSTEQILLQSGWLAEVFICYDCGKIFFERLIN